MEDNIKEKVISGYVQVLIFLLGSQVLSYDDYLLEIKNYYSNIVEPSSTEEEFLEAIENVIRYTEENKLPVPDWLIDIKAYVEINI